MEFQQALVVGAGTMGSGIAEVLARGGLQVVVTDTRPEALERARQQLTHSLDRALSKGRLSSEERLAVEQRVGWGAEPEQVDLVIEAVVENLSVKTELLGRLANRYPQAMLASNTSSLSLTEMAARCAGPERVVGLHFFNPAPVMELLEVVRAEQTSPTTLESALQLARRLGKTPIVVGDVAGFATSRLGILLGMEAIRMVESGVASVGDVDRAMELGYRHPMGPLKLTDLVGLDVRLAIAEHLTQELGSQFAPPPLLRRLVRAGYLGKKTGRGFYRWNGQQAEEITP
jgi:3-hydroxybutyryl-CoA dehydrogenase